jgi:hypothetical protein
VYPLTRTPDGFVQNSRQVTVYDPKTMQFTFIDTCFGTHHLNFAEDANHTLWLSNNLQNEHALVGWVNAPLSGSGGESLGEPGQLGGVDIRDQGASLLSLLPEDHVEPAIVEPVCLDRAQGIEATCRPGHAASGEYEERDRVQSPMEDEDGGLAIEEVTDGTPRQRELLVAEEMDDGSEVQAPLIPRLDAVHVAALYIKRMLAREEPQVVSDGFGDHAGRPVVLRSPGSLVVDGNGDEEYGGRRQRRGEGPTPSSPPRRLEACGQRPLTRESALQRQRRSMLGQPVLEDLGQQRLGCDLVLARGAGLHVSADVLLKPR